MCLDTYMHAFVGFCDSKQMYIKIRFRKSILSFGCNLLTDLFVIFITIRSIDYHLGEKIEMK